MSMPVSFPDHVALLAAYLDRRSLIVEAVERQVLNAQEHVITSDIQWAMETGATAFPRSHFLADRREGRYLASVEQDGKWFGLSKVVLTACLARDCDAVMSEVPASLVARLRLTCPEIIAADSHCSWQPQPSGESRKPHLQVVLPASAGRL